MIRCIPMYRSPVSIYRKMKHRFILTPIHHLVTLRDDDLEEKFAKGFGPGGQVIVSVVYAEDVIKTTKS